MSRSARLLLAAGAFGLALALTLASTLQPAAVGFGTHEQLGLAPCYIHSKFGIVCPTCGMTTAWAHASRGEFASAASCSAGGLLLWTLALIVSPWLMIAAVLGRWPVAVPQIRPLLWVGTAVLAATLLDWIRRLVAT